MILESYVFKFLKKELEHDVKKSSVVLLFAILSFYFIQFVVKCVIETKKLPPGPIGFFPDGLVRFIREGHEKHKAFKKLSEKYGSIFCCRLGAQLHIVISDYKMIRELMKKENLTGRPKSPMLSVLNGTGIINVDGKLWKDQRRFLHDKLRLFGMTQMSNGSKLQNLVLGEVNDLLLNLQGHLSKPIDLEDFFGLSVSNVICSLLMSERFTREDTKFIEFNRMIQEGMILFGKINIVEYFPIIEYLPYVQTVKCQISENRKMMFQYYKEVINRHRETFDKDNIRDVIDFYLLEIANADANQQQSSSTNSKSQQSGLFEGVDQDEQIMQIIGDLFSAGMETIRTTLSWLIVYMLRNPSTKLKIQEELDRVVGRQRMPTMDDKHLLPHTESTILEVMRMTSIVPLATTHSPLVDEELNGYKIPAGSHVVPLVSSVHMDSNLWDEPKEFRPSRFLVNGKVQKPEYFIPFGVGRRMCLGTILARIEVFVFFTSLMHRFDVSLPEGAQPPSLEGNPGVTYYPDKFEVCLKERPMETELTDDNTPIRSYGR